MWRWRGGGCQTSQPPERVPVANPRAVYTDYAMTTGQWYDLCDTGVVKLPSASGPCTGTQMSASPYRNWYWTAGNATTPGTWTLQIRGYQLSRRLLRVWRQCVT